ncbi:esterase [Sphingobacteriales bacterium UPWRP_1]|nr:hypothetical protein B6N25_02255 [Sphingobacteriales bacterium TSM_CSS]PSJ75569.1 esterase [Sphingobacteriales bacterium UPWRP_1]
MRRFLTNLKLSGRAFLSESFFYIVLLAGLLQFGYRPAWAQPFQNVTGTLERLENFGSKYVAPRQVDIWLPPGYQANTTQRYAVLYMHDGQNLFSPQTAYGGQEWMADETTAKLMEEGKIQPCIIVGIWNTAKRFTEYLPAKPFGLMPEEAKNRLKQERSSDSEILSDAYLKFIVKELKPYIDQHYRTLTARQHTFIAGSSMGGLISLYALCEYPRIFGGAACVSTHWPASLKENTPDFRNAYLRYLKKHLPKAGKHKIYFDYGTETLDAWYETHQQSVDAFMKTKKYFPKYCLSKKFDGEAHNELSWQKRFDIPLLFLLPASE